MVSFFHSKKENLISTLEHIYNDLRRENPEKDEHWLLINTWMKRYGGWEASKQKGPEVIKYISFKDTFQFSFLESPKSIRALSLFLVYKELGEKEAVSTVEEFNNLYGLIQEVYKKRDLLEEYKRKNPHTWNDLQNERDDSIYSLSAFLKASDYLNKNPDEEERVLKEMEG